MINQTPDVVWPEEYEKKLKQVEKAKAALSKAEKALEEVKKRAAIKCARCGVSHAIARQEYIQTYWYVRPYGCTEGDYWNDGEAQWECPDCKFLNRFDDRKDKYTTLPNSFYRPELVALRSFFKKIVEKHDD